MADQDLLTQQMINRIAQQKGNTLPPSPTSQEPAPDAPTTETDPNAFQPEALPEWGVNGPVGLANSIGSGAMEAILQTKDMFLGEPEQGDKSEFRLQHEADLAQLRESGWQNNITAAISQFGLGMLGAGKIMAPLKGTTKVGRAAWEIARGSLAASVVLDPHEARLSDLIQQYEPLRNPITEYLASDPNDPAVVGRFKNAIEGIGFDLLAVGLIEASVRALKFMRAGDKAGAEVALKELDGLQTKFDADAAARNAIEGTPTKPLTEAAEGAEGIRPQPSPKLDDIASPSGERRVAEVEIEGAPSSKAALDAPPPRDTNATIEPVRSEAAAVPLRTADQTYVPVVKVEEADVGAIVMAARAEAAAIKQFGSREAAIEAGAEIPKAGLPWKAMNATEDVETLVTSTARSIQSQMDAAKGGSVLTDAKVNEMVQKAAQHFELEPDAVMAEISRSGERATHMVADMEAAYIISTKMFQEAYALSVRVKAGLLDDFGGDAVQANREVARRMTAAADMLAQGHSMRATFGRGLRRQRREFAINPDDIARFKDIPPEKLLEILSSTGGDMAKLRQVANPSFLRRVIDEGAFLLTNNLLWNWVTHSVNLSTNLYMLAARPAEKMLGSLMLGTSGSTIRRQAMKEYAYTLYSVSDAWSGMVDAFLKADSKLLPYETEYFQAGLRVEQPQISFTAIKDTWDLFRNGIVAANYGQASKAALKGATAAYRTGVGLPTRSLGAIDEFIKQLRYRSVVQARASVEGSDRGLAGTDLQAYISKHLSDAFTPDGRALDNAAMLEAQKTTFQQELGQGTLGQSVQTFRANHPSAHFILPFVKTPVNVLRTAWNMTPGLNLLRDEYRQALGGKMGKEAQAHALGQMAIGSMFLATATNLALGGRITGGGPTDYALKRELMATGWQPYSIVIGEGDQKTYFPIGRFDPLGMPFGMVADLVDMLTVNPGSRKTEISIMSTAVALSKAFTEKTFLMNINQAMEALSNPGEDGSGIQKFFGNLAGNMIPGSSAIRTYANPDPYIRDARQFMDRMMSDMPGYSETIPTQRDFVGDSIWRKRGLTTTSDGDLVEAEHNRIILETGQGIRPPSPHQNGVDLRQVTLSDGGNAYDVYQQLVAKPMPNGPTLKDSLAKLIQSDGYSSLVDGEATVKGTKIGALMDIVEKYRKAGRTALLVKYPELRQQFAQRQMDVIGRLRAKRADQTTSRPTARDLLKSLGYAE